MIFDAVVLLFAYEVELDVQWRNAYASAHVGSATTGYGILTKRLQIVTASGQVLRSPPTLDWVQVAIAALIVVNVAFLLEAWKPQQKASVGAAQ